MKGLPLSTSLPCWSLASHSSSLSVSHLCLALSLRHTSLASFQPIILPRPRAWKYSTIRYTRVMVKWNINSSCCWITYSTQPSFNTLVWGLLKLTLVIWSTPSVYWSTQSVYLINLVSILGQLSRYTWSTQSVYWSTQSVYLINSVSVLDQLRQYTWSTQSVYLANSVSILVLCHTVSYCLPLASPTLSRSLPRELTSSARRWTMVHTAKKPPKSTEPFTSLCCECSS